MPADTAMEEAQRFRSVLREIERLPKAERHVLLLSAIEELGTPEIAAVLRRSESAVRALLSRARARLRERLEDRPQPERRRKSAMKDPDRTIENLLAGLRDAEPPPGMHHRILDAMVARPGNSLSSTPAVAPGRRRHVVGLCAGHHDLGSPSPAHTNKSEK